MNLPAKRDNKKYESENAGIFVCRKECGARAGAGLSPAGWGLRKWCLRGSATGDLDDCLDVWGAAFRIWDCLRTGVLSASGTRWCACFDRRSWVGNGETVEGVAQVWSG